MRQSSWPTLKGGPRSKEAHAQRRPTLKGGPRSKEAHAQRRPTLKGGMVDIAEFYAADERRRSSKEVEYGRD
ncbi:MAG: hypothetical protein ACYDH5_17670, partial [Acidimicrobiales bacterium]